MNRVPKNDELFPMHYRSYGVKEFAIKTIESFIDAKIDHVYVYWDNEEDPSVEVYVALSSTGIHYFCEYGPIGFRAWEIPNGSAVALGSDFYYAYNSAEYCYANRICLPIDYRKEVLLKTDRIIAE